MELKKYVITKSSAIHLPLVLTRYLLWGLGLLVAVQTLVEGKALAAGFFIAVLLYGDLGLICRVVDGLGNWYNLVYFAPTSGIFDCEQFYSEDEDKNFDKFKGKKAVYIN